LNCYPLFAAMLATITAIPMYVMSPKIFEKVQKKIGGAGCITCSPNNFVGGALAPPAPAVPRL